MLLPLPSRQLALSSLPLLPILMLLFSPLVDRRVSLLESRAVYVTSRYATRPGARYSYRGYEQWAIALLELILIEVVYRTKSAYGITISAASFALGGS